MQPAFLLVPVPEAVTVTVLELMSVPSQLGNSWLYHWIDFFTCLVKAAKSCAVNTIVLESLFIFGTVTTGNAWPIPGSGFG